MKQLLLSAAAALLACGSMSAVTYNIAEINKDDVTGTYKETTLKPDGSVQSYANWQPLQKIVLGDYTLTFSQDSKNKPALYTAKEGSPWTIRIYNGGTMTISAADGVTLRHIGLVTDTSTSANCSGASTGSFSFVNSMINWNSEEGAQSVTFTFTGTYRIASIELSDEVATPPVVETPKSTTIAELLEVANGSDFLFEGRAIVSYSNGSNAYLYDNSGATLLYLKGLAAKLPAGTVVTSMEGKRSDYNSTVEYIPTLESIKTDGTAEVVPVVCNTLADLEATTIDTYVKLVNVEFSLNAENVKYASAKFEDGTVATVYNAFTSTSYDPVVTYPEVGTYTLLGLRSAYKGETQFNFVKVEQSSGVADVETAAEGEAVFYNLQGVKVANPEHGIYIKVQNGKNTKVKL